MHYKVMEIIKNFHFMVRFLIKTLFLIAGIALIGFNSVRAASATNETNWVVVTNDDGIEVMERWVTNEKNVKVRERSGKMNLNCSVDEILALISDASKTHLWMNNVESVKVIKTVSPVEWYVQTNLDAPWPFGKQDMVSKYEVSKDPVNSSILVFISPNNTLLPKQKDIDRLDTFNAKWEIIPTERGKVKVIFTTRSTIPPEYPAWAQDPVVRKVFFANLRNFKSILVHS
jgi:hypothetical protein